MHFTWILGGIVIGVIAVVALSFAVMYLWNWLAPEVFNLPKIKFKHAFGILILSKILFGGFGGKHWHNRHEKFGENHHKEWKMEKK